MDASDHSPFLAEFMQQLNGLDASLKNIPAEEFQVAYTLLQDFIESINIGAKQVNKDCIEPEVEDDSSSFSLDQECFSCGFCCQVFEDEDKLLEHSDSCKQEADVIVEQSIISQPSTQLERRSRRKRSDPRKSVDHYKSDEEQLEQTNGSQTKRKQKIPKATAMGCKVVKDFKGDERFQCEHCELKFSYYAALLRHLDAVHQICDANKKIQEVNKKAVTCDLCGATLSSKGALHAHMQMHSGAQPFDCDVCGKKFSLKSNLLRHKRIHQGVKPYKCDLCDKRFTEKRSVEVHRRIHTGEKPYNCDICGMKFSQLGSWMGHRDTHKDKNETNYQCEVCDKIFTQKVGLLNHRKRHHEYKKSHKCEQCAQGFYSAEELRVHRVTHTGERPYLCEECGKSFARQQSLKNHMKLHNNTSSNLYECVQCSMKFSSLHSLNKHRRSQHVMIEEIIDRHEHVLQGDITTEELSILRKDVVNALHMEDVPSQDILEALSQDHAFQ